MDDKSEITFERMKRFFAEWQVMDRWIKAKAEDQVLGILKVSQGIDRRWRFTGRCFSAEGDTIMCEMKSGDEEEWIAIPMPGKDK